MRKERGKQSSPSRRPLAVQDGGQTIDRPAQQHTQDRFKQTHGQKRAAEQTVNRCHDQRIQRRTVIFFTKALSVQQAVSRFIIMAGIAEIIVVGIQQADEQQTNQQRCH